MSGESSSGIGSARCSSVSMSTISTRPESSPRASRCPVRSEGSAATTVDPPGRRKTRAWAGRIGPRSGTGTVQAPPSPPTRSVAPALGNATEPATPGRRKIRDSLPPSTRSTIAAGPSTSLAIHGPPIAAARAGTGDTSGPCQSPRSRQAWPSSRIDRTSRRPGTTTSDVTGEADAAGEVSDDGFSIRSSARRRWRWTRPSERPARIAGSPSSSVSTASAVTIPQARR